MASGPGFLKWSLKMFPVLSLQNGMTFIALKYVFVWIDGYGEML